MVREILIMHMGQHVRMLHARRLCDVSAERTRLSHEAVQQGSAGGVESFQGPRANPCTCSKVLQAKD